MCIFLSVEVWECACVGNVEVLCPCADDEALAQASEALAKAGGSVGCVEGLLWKLY